MNDDTAFFFSSVHRVNHREGELSTGTIVPAYSRESITRLKLKVGFEEFECTAKIESLDGDWSNSKEMLSLEPSIMCHPEEATGSLRGKEDEMFSKLLLASIIELD